MAAADKARYFLERSVPELQDLAKREIFSTEEIAAIVKKRNDFEHILNGPGHKPNDYVRYAVYEMNLDALQRKRCQRLGIKKSTHNGTRAVFFIYERATRKFPGDKSLWLQYIQFCQKEKANKKLAKAFTSVLRLRPREWGLWVLAAKHYAETQGDMSTARAYLQRGLRFCGDARQLYLQYAKLEMIYLAKMAARRKVLGLDEDRTAAVQDEDDNTIALPTVTGEDMLPEVTAGLEHVNEDMLKKLANAPVLQGAVPIAIFDSAMKQFHNSSDLAGNFFDLTLDFVDVPAIAMVQRHIMQHIESTAPGSADLVICRAKEALGNADIASAEFPTALKACLAVVRHAEQELSSSENIRLAEKVVLALLPYVENTALDDNVRRVLGSVVRTHLRRLASDDVLRSLLRRLEREDRPTEAALIEKLCDDFDVS